MLRTIRDRLSDFHQHNLQGHGHLREQTIQREGEALCRIASELGVLKTINSLINELEFNATGSEHAVAYNDQITLIKVTLPGDGFGLIPKVTLHRKLDIRTGIESHYEQIEFIDATPLEYLERWILCNDIFNDDVQLERVIQWADQSISIMISQPYYMGKIISAEEIYHEFQKNGWQRIAKHGRSVFYNFAYDAIALDLEPRNCYLADSGLQPFDLILSHPDEEMRKYLGLDS